MLTCPKCLGTGSLDGPPCPTCLGQTVVSPVVLACPACDGTGLLPPPYPTAPPQKCNACDANGSIVQYVATTDPPPHPYEIASVREALTALIGGQRGILAEHLRGFTAGLILCAGYQTSRHGLPSDAHLADPLDQTGRLVVAPDGIYHDPHPGPGLPVKVFSYEETPRA